MTLTAIPTDRQRQVLVRFSRQFLHDRAQQPGHRLHAAARWELDRRDHELRRHDLLYAGYRHPIAARDIRDGDVLSQGGLMRALVRAAYTLPSGQRVLGVSYLNLDTGEPETRVRELPVLAADDTSLHLVTRTLPDLAPYAAPMPAIDLPAVA
jgi:hypothetical protein